MLTPSFAPTGILLYIQSMTVDERAGDSSALARNFRGLRLAGGTRPERGHGRIEEQRPTSPRGDPRSHQRRIASALRVLLGFAFGQGALVGVNAFTGIYLVHALSVEAYAQFGLAFGFQTTVAALMDMGLGATIVPLVGERASDPELVGRYVRAAKHLRDRMFLVLSPIAAIAFVFIMREHHWNPFVQAALVVSALLALYSGGPVSYFSAPLILHGRLRQYYVPQTISALGRLLLSVALGAAGVLSSWAAAGLGAISVSANALMLGTQSRKHFPWAVSHDPAAAREIVHYVMPSVPAVVFYACQAQISLILVSIFGQTVSIAQVAALGRLSQIFAVLITFNLVVVEPRIARLRQSRLLRAYIALSAAACAFAGLVIFAAFRFPQVFLWLLGKKYESLGGLVGWVVVTACVGYVANLLWMMNRARRWLFWRGTILEIALTLSVDIGYVVFVGVKTTQQAIFFSLATSLCSLCTHLYITTYGFKRGPRARPQAAP